MGPPPSPNAIATIFITRLIGGPTSPSRSRYTGTFARGDVDWDRVAAHARAVGSLPACEAAVALAAELLGAPVPNALTPGRTARRHVARALSVRTSPIRTWLATEIWRAGTLWRCEKIAYRLAIRGATKRRIWMTIWTARMARLPILAVRAIGIVARAIVRCARRRQSGAAMQAGSDWIARQEG